MGRLTHTPRTKGSATPGARARALASAQIFLAGRRVLIPLVVVQGLPRTRTRRRALVLVPRALRLLLATKVPAGSAELAAIAPTTEVVGRAATATATAEPTPTAGTAARTTKPAPSAGTA